MLISQNPSGSFELKSAIPDNMPYDLIICRYRYLFLHVVRYILRSKPDCVFYSFPLLVPALILSKMLVPGLKVVFRDCNLPSTHAKYQSYPAKCILRYADALIAQTKEMKSEMAAFYHVKPSKITVINNPLDKALIRRRIKETYHYPDPGCTHYIAVARIAPQKDYITMIKAFAIVLQRDAKSRLEIVGNTHWDEAYKHKVDDLIDSLGLRSYVTFHGFQENPFKFVNTADVFLLSSIHEGLPNVMLEAMYLGKPVVVTRSIPYIAQVVHDGVNGYSVPVGSYAEFAEAMLKAREMRIDGKFIDVNGSEDQIVRLFQQIVPLNQPNR